MKQGLRGSPCCLLFQPLHLPHRRHTFSHGVLETAELQSCRSRECWSPPPRYDRASCSPINPFLLHLPAQVHPYVLHYYTCKCSLSGHSVQDVVTETITRRTSWSLHTGPVFISACNCRCSTEKQTLKT